MSTTATKGTRDYSQLTMNGALKPRQVDFNEIRLPHARSVIENVTIATKRRRVDTDSSMLRTMIDDQLVDEKIVDESQ